MNKLMGLPKNIHCIIIPSVLLFFFLTGCVVSSSKYQSLEVEHQSLKEETVQLEEDNLQLKDELDELQTASSELTLQKENQEHNMQKMIDGLQDAVEAKSVEIDVLEDTLQVKLVDQLFFAPGSASMTREGRKILARIAPILKDAKDHEIRVVGHCDRFPPGANLSKTYPSNWELSASRAIAIIQVLQWGHGIDPTRLVAEGVAHYRPLKMEDPEKDTRATNRVVEILLTTSPGSQ
jgi:chemotaxis protein MotB